MNILITGGLGILGNDLVKSLSKNHTLYLLDRFSHRNRKKIHLFNLSNKRFNLINGSFNSFKCIYDILKKKKIDVIFHLGAITQVIDAYKSPIKTFKTNILGTINIFEAVRLINKKIIIIYSSSDKAYGTLLGKSYKESHGLKGRFPYDVSKSASDLVAQSYSNTYALKVGIIRSGNIFGPGDLNLDRLVPGIIVNSINNKKTIIRSSGKLIRDYIYVKDVSRAYVLLMNKMLKSSEKLHIYNIGSKFNLSSIVLIKKILKLLNKIYLNPIIKNNSTIEIQKQKLDYSKARKQLGWYPQTNLNKGLLETVKWYKKNIDYFNQR